MKRLIDLVLLAGLSKLVRVLSRRLGGEDNYLLIVRREATHVISGLSDKDAEILMNSAVYMARNHYVHNERHAASSQAATA